MNLFDIKNIADNTVYKEVKTVGGGIFKLCEFAIVVTISIFMLFPERVFNSYDEYKAHEHDKMLEQRLQNTPEIEQILNEVSVQLKSDRAFICEFHNGTTNLSGLSFLHLDMPYEVVKVGIDNVDLSYSNLDLTKYKFAPWMIQADYWDLSTEDVTKIDHRYSSVLMRDDTKHITGKIIYSADNKLLGVVGVSYQDSSLYGTDAKVRKEILENAALKLGVLLTASKETNNKHHIY